MNLREWKDITIEHQRNLLKDALREGVVVTSHTLFTEEDIQEIKEEIQIEQFSEEVNVEDGDEVEFDTDLFEITDSKMEQIKELFFAESFVVIEESPSKAKVVFSRSKGKITKRKKCGKGMRLKGNRCIPQSGTQKAKSRMTGIKIKRAKKALGSKNKKAALKARITKKRVSGRSRNYSGT